MPLNVRVDIDAGYDDSAVLRGSYAVTHFFATLKGGLVANVPPRPGARSADFSSPLKEDLAPRVVDGFRLIVEDLFNASAQCSAEKWEASLDSLVVERVTLVAQLLSGES